MTESQEWEGFPIMDEDQRRTLFSELVKKLAYVLALKGQGMHVDSVEAAVRRQMADTITKGQITKA